jgi:hypothetical protein
MLGVLVGEGDFEGVTEILGVTVAVFVGVWVGV